MEYFVTFTYKYLGTVLDGQITIAPHIQRICRKDDFQTRKISPSVIYFILGPIRSPFRMFTLSGASLLFLMENLFHSMLQVLSNHLISGSNLITITLKQYIYNRINDWTCEEFVYLE